MYANSSYCEIYAIMLCLIQPDFEFKVKRMVVLQSDQNEFSV